MEWQEQIYRGNPFSQKAKQKQKNNSVFGRPFQPWVVFAVFLPSSNWTQQSPPGRLETYEGSLYVSWEPKSRAKKTENFSLVLVKLKRSERMLIAEGDTDEHFNILINSEHPPSGFWQLRKRAWFSGLLTNQPNWNCKSGWDKYVMLSKSFNDGLL